MQVDSAYNAGRYEESRRASDSARKINYIGIGIGIFLIVAYVTTVVVVNVSLAASADSNNDYNQLTGHGILLLLLLQNHALSLKFVPIKSQLLFCTFYQYIHMIYTEIMSQLRVLSILKRHLHSLLNNKNDMHKIVSIQLTIQLAIAIHMRVCIFIAIASYYLNLRY